MHAEPMSEVVVRATMIVYLGTSELVKLYVDDEGSLESPGQPWRQQMQWHLQGSLAEAYAAFATAARLGCITVVEHAAVAAPS